MGKKKNTQKKMSKVVDSEQREPTQGCKDRTVLTKDARKVMSEKKRKAE